MTTWFFNASGPNVFLLIFLLFALLFVFLDNEELPTAASVFPAWWHALCMTWWPFLCCLRIHTELEKRLGTPHLIFEKVTTTSGPGVGWGRAFNVNMQVPFANVFDGQLSSAFSVFGMFSLFTVMVHCSMGKPLMLHLFTQTGVALLLAFAGAVAVIRLLQELKPGGLVNQVKTTHLFWAIIVGFVAFYTYYSRTRDASSTAMTVNNFIFPARFVRANQPQYIQAGPSYSGWQGGHGDQSQDQQYLHLHQQPPNYGY